jgi:hypothetical protein
MYSVLCLTMRGFLCLTGFLFILSLASVPSHGSELCVGEADDVNAIESLSIKTSKPRKWVKNYLRLERKPGQLIDPAFKGKFKASIKVIYSNGIHCEYSAKIRINGDLKDHISNQAPVTSLDVKLDSGSIGSVVRFKLFLPETRNSDNEIFFTELLSLLGYLAPNTFYVDAKINDVEQRYLFQEKISKEFLESNNRRESAIIEGDERFYYTDKEDIYAFGLARLVNESWAKKGQSSLLISTLAVNKANVAYLDYFYRYKPGRSSYLKSNLLAKNMSDIDNTQTYEALMVAAGAPHGLGTNNRKFYYDPIYDYLEPIYYDGNVTFLDQPNGWRAHVDNKVSPGQVSGALLAKEKLAGLDIETFKRKLEAKGILLSIDKLNNYFSILTKNLTELSLTTEDSNLTKKDGLGGDVSRYNRQRTVFSTDDRNRFVNCDINQNHCFDQELTDEQVADLLSGDLDTDEFFYVYFGKKTSATLPSIKGGIDFKLGSSYIRLLNGMQASYNLVLKEMTFHPKSHLSKVLIYGGRLDGWSIFVLEAPRDASLLKNDDSQRFDENLLTGCLTLIDIELSGVRLTSDGCVLEDAVNLVRVRGSIERLEVRRAEYDGLDADFSDVILENVFVASAGNDCVDFSSGRYFIGNAQLLDCGDKGVSAGEKSNVDVKNIEILGAAIGIASKDSSVVTLHNYSIDKVTTCLAVYNKKQEFSGATVLADLSGCGKFPIDIDKYSNVGELNEF